MMKIEVFKNQLDAKEFEGEDPFLKALWHDHKGAWSKAHQIIDPMPGKDAAWVHAYLHRKEGDIWNADYWYAKAQKIRPSISLEEEWENLVQNFTS